MGHVSTLNLVISHCIQSCISSLDVQRAPPETWLGPGLSWLESPDAVDMIEETVQYSPPRMKMSSPTCRKDTSEAVFYWTHCCVLCLRWNLYWTPWRETAPCNFSPPIMAKHFKDSLASPTFIPVASFCSRTDETGSGRNRDLNTNNVTTGLGPQQLIYTRQCLRQGFSKLTHAQVGTQINTVR